MGEDRTVLNMNIEGLDDFAPKKPKQLPAEVKKAVDKVASFPSREASGIAQMNITGDKAVLDRFDRICKEDRRSRHAMLEILMNAFEKGQDG